MTQNGDKIIILRTPSGISGDMLLTGLARLAGVSNAELSALIDAIGLDALHDAACIKSHNVNHISGWHAHINLPHEHHHRTLGRILNIIAESTLAEDAKTLAKKAFTILGEAESKVHGIALDKVHFHEVGALDSILDICAASALYCRIGAAALHCSPLPMADGMISCEHGLLASPPPAVQEMLAGIPVYGVDAEGETVTPTALAFLKAVDAQFGKWPEATIITSARAYGGKIFRHIPNGAMFFLARSA